MRLLVTGGCGFIGHHIVEHVMKSTDWEVIVLDKLSYASKGFDRLRGIDAFGDKRLSVFTVDLVHPINAAVMKEIGVVDYLIHTAAETHVDRSLKDPETFLMNNIIGTCNVLRFAMNRPELKKMIHVSTDEVFGPANVDQRFKEWDRYNCTNPYSASKAGAEELALSYASSYGLPVVIVHPSNAFGERQHVEKFLPKAVKCILDGGCLDIHTDKDDRVCTRYWIHARNIADALVFLLLNGQNREKYNIVGEREIDVLTIGLMVADVLGREFDFDFISPNSIRPGNDHRYDLDGSRITELGWRSPIDFETSFKKTVLWMRDNPEWLLEDGQ
ncbi:MAG: GDP-mannose 4,6-dehydratase [Sphaerochaeta sp.]|jgi:dTDP-glucose 4,6-dehydratase|nr:GDP-mannose 4,6-dehydratase [Sphaerochaeta sp.]